MKFLPRTRRGKIILSGVIIVLGAGAWWGKSRWFSQIPFSGSDAANYAAHAATTSPFNPKLQPYTPADLATWPLPRARQDTPHQGVTHWYAKDKFGTTVDFFDFDFGKNPRLRWGLYDQDEADEKPLDNFNTYGPRSVARFTKEYNAGALKRPKGTIVAAWNGAFYGYHDQTTKFHAFHVSPIVVNGKVLFNNANHRWTFGVKYDKIGKPDWKVFFKPSRKTLQTEYDWAAGSLQYLVKDGKPLKTEPFPKFRKDIKRKTQPSTPQEAGHIAGFDHMRTCRASIAWSKDKRHLYLVVVKEPDNESTSYIAFAHGAPDRGGWTVPDVQRFWLKKGVWGAVNSDAGNVGQLVFRQPAGGYTFVPSRQSTGIMRMNCPPNWRGAPPGGGALMFFYIWEK